MWYQLGVLAWVFSASFVIELVFLRKLAQPQKQYYSLIIVWAFSTYFGANHIGTAGSVEYLSAALEYGFAAVLIGVIYFVSHKLEVKAD
jgi:hypothetical protein